MARSLHGLHGAQVPFRRPSLDDLARAVPLMESAAEVRDAGLGPVRVRQARVLPVPVFRTMGPAEVLRLRPRRRHHRRRADLRGPRQRRHLAKPGRVSARRPGAALAVAGVPPDYFSSSGQLWGNPLYNWDYLARTQYAWWIARLRSAFALYDIVRLDHFRGFDTYWEIPASAESARSGRWRKGPGTRFFKAVERALPGARIIAEDLGYIGANVVKLRRRARLPGMKILQFAYGHDRHNVNLPHFYPADSVAYTGTHDNNTTRGWLESLSEPYAGLVDDYFQMGGSKSAWPMIRTLLATSSRLAVVPMQDLLDLPASATLNRPGKAEGNWQWRFTRRQLGQLSDQKLATLRHWVELYDRTGDRALSDFSEPPEA